MTALGFVEHALGEVGTGRALVHEFYWETFGVTICWNRRCHLLEPETTFAGRAVDRSKRCCNQRGDLLEPLSRFTAWLSSLEYHVFGCSLIGT